MTVDQAISLAQAPTDHLEAHRVLVREIIRLRAQLGLKSRDRTCPECGAEFVRVRRQLYCSPRCRHAVSMRSFLSRHGKTT